MRGREPKYDVPEASIIAMRKDGYSCREIAERWAIPEHRVWYVMQRTGNAGRYHAAPTRDGSSTGKRAKVDTHQRIADVLDEWGVLTIEEGAGGGYVATLDDEHTGPERQSVRAAIDAAAKAAREEADEWS